MSVTHTIILTTSPRAESIIRLRIAHVTILKHLITIAWCQPQWVDEDDEGDEKEDFDMSGMQNMQNVRRLAVDSRDNCVRCVSVFASGFACGSRTDVLGKRRTMLFASCDMRACLTLLENSAGPFPLPLRRRSVMLPVMMKRQSRCKRIQQTAEL